MKLTQLAKLLTIGLILSLASVGCQSGKHGPTELPDSGGSQTKTIGEGGKLGGGGTAEGGPGTVGIPAAPFDPDDYNPDRSALAAQTLYFDFDSATVKSSEQSKLSAVASALQSDSSAKLLIEGNCDERGTEEYNRSLGERRAMAAREALAGMGVSAARVATRSYGEDRPADPGHDQTAWAKNRRDEFVLLHPK